MRANLAWCSRIFREHNKECFEKIFGYTLPDIVICSANCGRALGQFWHNKDKAHCIVLNATLDFDMKTLRSVILHEMLHYYLFLNGMEKEAHDNDFISNMNKINENYSDKIEVYFSGVIYKYSKR